MELKYAEAIFIVSEENNFDISIKTTCPNRGTVLDVASISELLFCCAVVGRGMDDAQDFDDFSWSVQQFTIRPINCGHEVF